MLLWLVCCPCSRITHAECAILKLQRCSSPVCLLHMTLCNLRWMQWPILGRLGLYYPLICWSHKRHNKLKVQCHTLLWCLWPKIHLSHLVSSQDLTLIPQHFLSCLTLSLMGTIVKAYPALSSVAAGLRAEALDLCNGVLACSQWWGCSSVEADWTSLRDCGSG